MLTPHDERWLALSADIDTDDPTQVDAMRAAIEIAADKDSAATLPMIRRLYGVLMEDGL
jgi:hypothetical protein